MQQLLVWMLGTSPPEYYPSQLPVAKRSPAPAPAVVLSIASPLPPASPPPPSSLPPPHPPHTPTHSPPPSPLHTHTHPAEVLRDFAGKMAVWSDVDRRLQESMKRMAEFVCEVDMEVLAAQRAEDWETVKQGAPLLLLACLLAATLAPLAAWLCGGAAAVLFPPLPGAFGPPHSWTWLRRSRLAQTAGIRPAGALPTGTLPCPSPAAHACRLPSEPAAGGGDGGKGAGSL